MGTATLITRTTNDVTQVQQLAFMSLRMMIRAPLMAIGGVIMAVAQDARLSLIFSLSSRCSPAVIWLISSRGMPLFKVMQEKLDRLNLVTREGLSGIRVVRAFNRTRI